MKPIWYFVGIMLFLMGILVVLGGFAPNQHPTVLSHTRPNLWWGAIMIVAGGGFWVFNRNRTVD